MEKDLIILAFKVRIVMLTVGRLLEKNGISIPVHLAFGHELIAAKVVRSLAKNAEFFLPHRNAHYSICIELLDKDLPRDYLCEVIGGVNSKFSGRLGSMNYTDPNRKGYTSSILANHLGPAVGAAMYFKFKNVDKRAVAVIGDGAAEEGRFWEALQFAFGKKLPLDIVIEDNDWSMQSQTWQRRSEIKFEMIPEIMSQKIKLPHTFAMNSTIEGPRIIHERCKTFGGIFVQDELKEKFLNYHCGKIYSELPLNMHRWSFGETDPLANVRVKKEQFENLRKYESELNELVESIVNHALDSK